MPSSCLKDEDQSLQISSLLVDQDIHTFLGQGSSSIHQQHQAWKMHYLAPPFHTLSPSLLTSRSLCLSKLHLHVTSSISPSLLKDHSRKEASLFTCTMGSLLSSSYCKNISHEAFLLLSSQYCKTRSWNGPKPWTPLQKLTTAFSNENGGWLGLGIYWEMPHWYRCIFRVSSNVNYFALRIFDRIRLKSTIRKMSVKWSSPTENY